MVNMGAAVPADGDHRSVAAADLGADGQRQRDAERAVTCRSSTSTVRRPWASRSIRYTLFEKHSPITMPSAGSAARKIFQTRA